MYFPFVLCSSASDLSFRICRCGRLVSDLSFWTRRCLMECKSLTLMGGTIHSTRLASFGLNVCDPSRFDCVRGTPILIACHAELYRQQHELIKSPTNEMKSSNDFLLCTLKEQKYCFVLLRLRKVKKKSAAETR